MLKKSPRRCNQQSLDGEKLYRTNKPISSKKKNYKEGGPKRDGGGIYN